MTNKLSFWVVTFGAVILASGCAAAQRGRIYDVKTGHASELVIDRPTANGGKIVGTLPTGASCKGAFNTLSVDNAERLAGLELLLTDNTDTSVALLICDSGGVLRCTMAQRSGDTFSYGLCKDDHGVEYSVMF